MKTYELTYIITPEIISEEAEAAAKEIESFIKSKEGAVLRQTNPTAKTLSYLIKKQASGFMGVLEFQSEPEMIDELKKKMDKDGKFIRHMLIIKKPVKEHKKRRTRKAAIPVFEKKEAEIAQPESFTKASESKGKVELKDIEQKLDEILGE